jgi:hypothetical protein
MDRIRVLAGMLACALTVAVFAAQPSGSIDMLDDLTVSGVLERQRQALRPGTVRNPDIITVTRKGDIRVRMQPRNPVDAIHFRRPSAARQAIDKSESLRLQSDRITSSAMPPLMLDVRFRMVADVSESDGLPAVISFGPRTSLLNVDYLRLLGTANPTLTRVKNVIDVQTRKCMDSFGLADRGDNYPNRFLLVGDRIRDCRNVLESREGDLFFAEDVPEHVRQSLHEIYDPLANRFARWFGSEPGLMFVAWRPDSPRSSLRFVTNWGRGALVLLEGKAWQQGLSPQLRNTLWDDFALEQLHRRIAWQQGSDVFVESAMDYLMLLVRADRDQDTKRRLIAELPGWIAGCGRDEGAGKRFGHDCGMLLQFVYDAVIRAQSKGEDTIFNTWQRLLAESFRQGESGVDATAFIASSGEGRSIAQGLLNGEMYWAAFAEDLARIGVQLRLKPGQYAPLAEVLSLTNFRD